MSPWNEKLITQLKALWASGLSASQISESLGGVSRSAVLGKVRRLNLPSRLTTSRRNASRRKGQQAPPRLPHRVKNRPCRAPAWRYQIISPHSEDENDPPPDQRVPLLDLRRDMCRWPCGDPKQPDFGFCGRRQVPGLSYCTSHARRAFRFNKRRR